ncbi:MAG TPA: DUF5687 family protein [Puia sp.]|nr:DUF5687 family protein [Puia sp.]
MKNISLILLSHQWKSFWRSRGAGKNVGVQIFIGFIMLYILANALVLGFTLGTIITRQFPGQDAIEIFCGFILYYFSFDIIMRFMLQDLPTLAVQPYLIQNIKRKTLVSFLNVRSLFTIFNLLPLVLFIPFAATNIAQQYGSIQAMLFIWSVVTLCIGNHFLVLFIKRKTFVSSWWMVGFFVLVIGFITADYADIFSMRKVSTAIFLFLLQHSWLVILALFWAFLSFFCNYFFLRRSLYLEDDAKSSGTNRISGYSWLERFGIVGDLMSVDIKMMLRNKRPGYILLLSCFFILYGFIMYKPQAIDKNEFGLIMTGAIFITGIFIVNYGQFLFAWQSAHFDGMMTTDISIKEYIKSKISLMIGICTITFLISLCYGFVSWKIIPVEMAAYLFNIGIHTVLVCLIATRNYKGLDISKKAAFNFQGVNATQWVYMLAIVLISLIFYLPFALFINVWAGILSMSFFGIIFLLLHNWWVDVIVGQFKKNKYKILSGFREK